MIISALTDEISGTQENNNNNNKKQEPVKISLDVALRRGRTMTNIPDISACGLL